MDRIIQGEGSSPFSRPTKAQRKQLKKYDKKISSLDTIIKSCRMFFIEPKELVEKRKRYDQKRKSLRLDMKGYK